MKLRKIKTMRRRGRTMLVSTGLDKVHEEIAIMKRLEHPSILEFHEALLDEEKDTLILVLEYCQEGQLMTWDRQRYCYTYNHEPSSNNNQHENDMDENEKDMDENEKDMEENGMTEEKAREYFRQVVEGLLYLHSNEKILVTVNGDMKIADFGVSHLFEKNKNEVNTVTGTFTTSAGTRAFSSPESLSGEAYDGFATDVWALGVTLFAMTTGKLPFHARNIYVRLLNFFQNSKFKIIYYL